MLVTQSCLVLCDPIDCSLPGSSVHGILQVRILKWAAIPDPGIEPQASTFQVDSVLSEPPGKFHISPSLVYSRVASNIY